MIAFIGYVMAVSLLLVAAAVAIEPLLRATRRPIRSAWIAAMLGAAIAAMVALWAAPAASRTSATSSIVARGEGRISVAGSSGDVGVGGPRLAARTGASAPGQLRPNVEPGLGP